MYLRVNPASHLNPVMSVPASKPETQRAIVTATLATGRPKSIMICAASKPTR